ncbi:DUF2249 domain-containing protein [Cryobacterium algoritolerans]|uniref:DUF2249 domain-containing protein n=1 Tax=Cryobacterium algoritolerans TaxID=1259184 RepID=A0A4R8WMG5_9MICO|nr:DUF2249 domain-containing protein [Cryobacterium algoritolerans]TFC09627.1 DUF2249 domain-containing protein [Cryobacterium algoritolerans]
MTAEPITLSDLRPGHPEATDAAAPGHNCQCDHDDAETIVLDGRTIPHAVRHAAIFGALEAIRLGFALDLIAPHDPLPLIAQLEKSRPGAFAVSYLERGPEAWQVRFTRVS